jgi:hypothetical protein
VQEVLINVCESIQFCRDSGTRAGVLAIDMAKAFDTLDHKFIEEVYKFFGFGNNMIRWLRLLGNQRQACISLDNTRCSRFFNLGSGRPQGDNLSPVTFNFCEQILIFRLELDPRIASIPRHQLPIVNAEDPFLFESNRETSKNESLADDNTVITLLQYESLNTIKIALESFSAISGLHCNYDKTVILPIFRQTDEEMEILRDLGFKSVDKIKLLGMDLTNNYADISGNFVQIRDKILRLVRFWERFKLSLPGRIAIAKTFLVSQLNYLGCVFRPEPHVLADIQLIINGFIKKNLNISRDRICRPVELGGLGFFILEDFLAAQRCSWIFKAKKLTIDNWRYDLCNCAPNYDVLQLRSSDISINKNPVLFGIVCDYEKFYSRFSAEGNNFMSSFIFENSIFPRADDSGRLLDKNFFGLAFYEENKNFIRSLKFGDCFRNNVFLSMEEWRGRGLNLTVNTWLRLRNALCLAKTKFKSEGTKIDSVADFSARLKKGSRKIRKFFEAEKNRNLELSNLPVFLSFCRIIDHVPRLTYLNDWISIWKINSFTNDFKSFVMQCRFNTLALNNRLHSFLPDIDPRCTYCKIVNPNTQERDSFSHCFLLCETVKNILTDFFSHMNVMVSNNDDFLNLYWFGQYTNDDSMSKNTVQCYNIVFDILRYVIYKSRLKHYIPSTDMVLNHVKFIIQCICRASKKLKDLLLSTPALRFLTQAIG